MSDLEQELVKAQVICLYLYLHICIYPLPLPSKLLFFAFSSLIPLHFFFFLSPHFFLSPSIPLYPEATFLFFSHKFFHLQLINLTTILFHLLVVIRNTKYHLALFLYFSSSSFCLSISISISNSLYLYLCLSFSFSFFHLLFSSHLFIPIFLL